MKERLQYLRSKIAQYATRYGSLSKYDIARLSVIDTALTRPLKIENGYVRIGDIESVFAVMNDKPLPKQKQIEWLNLNSPENLLEWRIENLN